MRILLTGNEGFIGRHVHRLLVERGHEVIGVDCMVRQVHGPLLLPNPSETHCESVGEFAERWDEGWAPIDAVVHLAAEVGVGQSQYEPARYVDGNVLETVKLWEAILRHREDVRKVVVAGSMSSYGEPGTSLPISETLEPQPASIYALTKLDQEKYSLLLGKTYGIPTVALRFFNTYGPGQSLSNPYTGVVASFACRALNGNPPLVNEDGLQSRDFVYVEDVARAVVIAVEQPELAGTFNVCTGTATTIGRLAELWCKVAAGHGFPRVTPLITGQYRKGDVRHCIGSHDALTQATSWLPSAEVEDGLHQLANWIVENQLHKNLPQDRNEEAVLELRQHGLLSAEPLS